MSNACFRMYHEFATDPKVQMLSEADQRRFVMILCLRCCNDDVTLRDDEIAFQLRISSKEWSETKAILLSKGLITDDNKPTAWDKRQYVSDTSKSRVARHREKIKSMCNDDVTLRKRSGNALDTDTDTDTDTEKRRVADATITPEFLEAKKVADYLAKKMIESNPNSSPKPNNWIADIEKAIRIDKKSTSTLIEIIDWMYTGDRFWAGVVLSGKKLREKFDQMSMQRISKQGAKYGAPVSTLPKRKFS
jgi:hypothetical protein